MKKTPSKLPYREFIERSIKALRKPPYKGIHVVYSNFNEAFRQYYGEDPRSIIDQLVKEGFLVFQRSRGGGTISLAAEVGQKPTSGSSEALAKILSESSDNQSVVSNEEISNE